MYHCFFLLYFLSSLFVSSSRMSVTNVWDPSSLHPRGKHPRLRPKHHHYISISPISSWLCSATLSSNFIPNQWQCITVSFYCTFCLLYLFHPHGWVQQMFGTTYRKGSTFLSDHIIAIYPYLFDCAVSYFVVILFQRNGAVSLSPFLLVLCIDIIQNQFIIAMVI